MKQVLVCRNCEKKLTTPLEVTQSGDSKYIEPDWDSIDTFGNPGTAIKSSNKIEYKVSGATEDFYPTFVPQYWVRLDDLLDSVGVSSFPDRLLGCCVGFVGENLNGFEGSNGPNRTCECGRHVGTEFSDCWTAEVFIPDPKETKWQNVKS